MDMTRKGFVDSMVMAAGGLCAGCASSGKPAFGCSDRFSWGCLLHLGSNMWDDFENGPDDWAKSEEEERQRPNPFGPSGNRRSSYHSYLRCHDDLWRKSVDHAAKNGLDLVFIDLGEGIEYPSHPELKVAGTWSVDR